MRQKRALILEDDPEIRELIKVILTRHGFKVKSCDSPLNAAHFVNPCAIAGGNGAGCTDVIITDIHMPNMTGIEFVKQIRQAGCRTKHIAIMSGDWNDENECVAQDLKCKIFTKPMCLQDISAWLESLNM